MGTRAGALPGTAPRAPAAALPAKAQASVVSPARQQQEILSIFFLSYFLKRIYYKFNQSLRRRDSTRSAVAQAEAFHRTEVDR
jgi:hypothetical protein